MRWGAGLCSGQQDFTIPLGHDGRVLEHCRQIGLRGAARSGGALHAALPGLNHSQGLKEVATSDREDSYTTCTNYALCSTRVAIWSKQKHFQFKGLPGSPSRESTASTFSDERDEKE